MRQTAFEERYRASWDAFALWIERGPAAASFAASEFPARYRALCQQLALARDRQYSPELVDRLNLLALRGYHLLYGARTDTRGRVFDFLLRRFPQTVRAEWRPILAAALLFFGPLVAVMLLVQWMPQAVDYLLDPRERGQLEAMYGNATQQALGRRGAEDDLTMFGFYIMNNVKIGFQTFATGLLFGLGTVFYLAFNAVHIGAAAGYLGSIGLAANFWSFVAGHSAMELIAIALAGGAGLRLGLALVAPGRRTRRAALVHAARPAVRIIIGAALMFLVAAFVEAFWSPHPYLPREAKWAIGATLWVLVLGYLVLAGRGAEKVRDDED